MKEFVETLYPGYRQGFDVDRVLYESRTAHQHLLIFEHAYFGRVMALDGIVQTTERDEFIYHEMMAHTPLVAHPDPRRVLVIGGGDGAMLREVVKHPTVESVIHVEIDRAVIDMSREYLPNHSAGAFDDARVELVIADGLDFVRTTTTRFDVIISDSTDPIGPGEVLFSDDFYRGCHDCLEPGGIFVAQNGVAFLQPDEVTTSAERLARVFADRSFYAASVPTYAGGLMTFAWGSDDISLRETAQAVLAERFSARALKTRYYNPAIHCASFALPGYITALIDPAADALRADLRHTR